MIMREKSKKMIFLIKENLRLVQAIDQKELGLITFPKEELQITELIYHCITCVARPVRAMRT